MSLLYARTNVLPRRFGKRISQIMLAWSLLYLTVYGMALWQMYNITALKRLKGAYYMKRLIISLVISVMIALIGHSMFLELGSPTFYTILHTSNDR